MTEYVVTRYYRAPELLCAAKKYGTEIDMWATYGTPGSNGAWNAIHDQQTRDWQTGDTIIAGAIASCGSFTAGSGWMSNGSGATASGACLEGGLLRANELAAGSINHALSIILDCGNGPTVYPDNVGLSNPDSVCRSGVGVPLGGHLWYDVPDATTNANSGLHPWEKAVLNALHDYGGYAIDTVSGGDYNRGLQFLAESVEPWRDYGNANPFAALAAQGWFPLTIPNAIGTASGTRWVGADPWNPSGVNFAAHMHWLAPCSAQGTC